MFKMRDVRTLCWRHRRKITAVTLMCLAMYVVISVTATKRTLSNSDAQDIGKDNVHHQRNHKKPSRKIHRIAHNPLPDHGEGGKGVVQDGEHKGGEEEYSSSSALSGEEDAAESEGKSAEPTKKFPQAILIGVKKGGTRALLEFISLHPDVKVATQEIHFFDRNYEKGLDWYRDQMPLSKPGQITMEKTPSYFITEEVPKRIRQLNKDTKLVVVVRDPVTRAISDFAQSVAMGRRSPADFDRLAVPDPKTGAVDGDWYPIMIGRYADHVERWLKYFPRRQFLFINGDELVSSPAKQLIRVQEFLKIDTVIDEQYFVYNKTKGFYCVKTSKEGQDIKCLGDAKGRAHHQVSPSVLNSLRKFFQPHNERFYTLARENFHWGESEGQR